MTTVGLPQLVIVTFTLAMTVAMTIRKEQVFFMEVQVEETERRQNLSETENSVERQSPQERESQRSLEMEKLKEGPDAQKAGLVKLMPAYPPSLPALVQELGLSELYGAVSAAGLAGTLSGPGPFTLFGPTNKAFAAAKPWVDYLKSNVTALREVLTYHVLGSQVFSGDIKDEASISTLLGPPIRFNIYPNNKVVTAQCAPVDPQHMDINASNGVLHELKALMVPPVGSIAHAITQLDIFTTLVKALTIADLLITLKDEGPFTVFAPTNAAFSKLDPEVLDDLLKNKTALKDVLLYHMVNLTYCRPGLVSYTKLEMLNKQDIKITVRKDEVKVNGIVVMAAGVKGSVTNGVIHVISTVLIPPSYHHQPSLPHRP